MNQGYPIAKERERKRSVNVDIWHALDLSSILILISLIWLLLYTSYARKRWWLITLTAPGSSWRYFSITQRSHSRSLRIFSSDLLLSFSFSLASFLLHFLLYVNTKNSSFSYRSEYVEQRANERFGATHTHTLNIPPFLSSLLSSHRRVCLTHWSKYIHRLNAIKIDSICTHVSLFPSLFNEHSEKKKKIMWSFISAVVFAMIMRYEFFFCFSLSLSLLSFISGLLVKVICYCFISERKSFFFSSFSSSSLTCTRFW